MRAFLAGTILGMAGSAHCIVMCGPLVLAAGRRGAGLRATLVSFATYHAGRGLMYQAIAVPAALFGQVFTIAGLSGPLSVTCGLLMLGAAIPARPAPASLGATWMRPLGRASAAIGGIARERPLLARFLGGVVNGLLPCGLTYAAALTAAALGGVPAAAAFMAGFCAGTLPILAIASLCGTSLPRAATVRLRWLAPTALVIGGGLLIVRGLEPVTASHGHPAGSQVHLLHRHGPAGDR